MLLNLFAMSLAASQPEPVGHYDGQKNLMGYDISLKLRIDPHSDVLDFSLHLKQGPVDKGGLVCKSESYRFDATQSTIVLTDLSSINNCVTKALTKQNLALEKITYASAVDQVVVDVKAYGLLKLDFQLSHKVVTTPQPTPFPTPAPTQPTPAPTPSPTLPGATSTPTSSPTSAPTPTPTFKTQASLSFTGATPGSTSNPTPATTHTSGSSGLAASWRVFVALLVLMATAAGAGALLCSPKRERTEQLARIAAAAASLQADAGAGIDFRPRSSAGYGIVFSGVTYDVKDRDHGRIGRKRLHAETATPDGRSGSGGGGASGSGRGGCGSGAASGAKSDPKQFRVVDSVSGYAKPGQLVAILGPSGCGKSSLLDILAGRPKLGQIGGEIRITTNQDYCGDECGVDGNSDSNGEGNGKVSKVKKTVSYLSQEDPATLLETETVLETLLFSAHMRATDTAATICAVTAADEASSVDSGALDLEAGGSPPTTPTAAISSSSSSSALATPKGKGSSLEANVARAYQLLHLLKLSHVAQAKVGRLSGGERRRLSLGVELVTNPDCLLCDEVTSALDSKSCDLVLDLLGAYCRQGHCAMVTIHQPSTRVLSRFSSVLLLSPGGQQLYFGPAKSEGFGVARVERIMLGALTEYADEQRRGLARSRSALHRDGSGGIEGLDIEAGVAADATATAADAEDWCDYTAAEQLLELAAISPPADAASGGGSGSLWREGGSRGQCWCAAVRRSVLADGAAATGATGATAQHSHARMLEQVDGVMRTTRSRHSRLRTLRLQQRGSSVRRLFKPENEKESGPLALGGNGNGGNKQPISLHPGSDEPAPPAAAFAATQRGLGRGRGQGVRKSLRRFRLLCARSVRQWLRDPSLLATQLALVLLMAGLVGGFAHDLARDFTGVQTRVFLFNFMVLFFSLLGMSSIGTLVQERHVFARERASGFYTTGLSYLNTLACDMLLLRVLPPLLFGSLVYGLVGLNGAGGAAALANFLLVLVLVNVAASAFCMLLSAACRDVSTANLAAAAFFLYSYMFSGLFMAGTKGPAAAIKYTSIFFYAWEALVSNEFSGAGNMFLFNPAGEELEPITSSSNIELTGDVILANFSLHSGRFAMDTGVLVAFIAVVLAGTFGILHASKFRR